MAADVAADGEGSYSLEEEIELLEAIYIHELTLEGERERPTAVSVLLHPSTGDEEDKRFVCLTLHISLPKKYPCELPSIHIKTPRGLSEAHIDRRFFVTLKITPNIVTYCSSFKEAGILANLRELAEGCLGRPMLYELIEYAKESLTDNNMPSCACAICLSHFQDSREFTKTECYHYFHCGCLARYIEFSLQQEKETEDDTKVECPMCRLPITYNLEELKAVASSDVNEEELIYKPSKEIKKLQKEMSSLFEKQKRKGGVIDLEEERNRFLIDITSVRQEETVPESEPLAGSETDTVTKNPPVEHAESSVPTRGGVAAETIQPDGVIRKDKSEKKDKKEFSNYSGTSRGRQRPVDKTGNQSSEDKFKRREQKRTEKKHPATCNRPKTAEQRLKEKETVKQSGKQGGDFALWGEDKPKSSQSGRESQKNAPPLDNSEKVVTGVCEGSRNSSSSQHSYGEKPRSARRGRGRSGRGRSSAGSTHGSREGSRDANKNRTSSGEVGKSSEEAGSSESVKAIPDKNGRFQNQAKENPSDKRGETNNKDKVCKPPPGFENLKTDKGETRQSTNNSRPPPGFEQLSTGPRPPPGLGIPVEGAGPTTSQSITS